MKIKLGAAFAKMGGGGTVYTVDTKELAGEVAKAGADAAAEVIRSNLRSGLLPDGSPAPLLKDSTVKRKKGDIRWGIRTGAFVESIHTSVTGNVGLVECGVEWIHAMIALGGQQSLKGLAQNQSVVAAMQAAATGYKPDKS